MENEQDISFASQHKIRALLK